MSCFRYLLVLLSVLLLVAQAISQVDGEDVALSTKNGQIHGTLLVPEVSEPIPIVMIIAGSGPTDRDGNNSMMKNNSLKMIAEGLFENGIASLRYDKRGIAGSADAAISEVDLRFEDFVNDAKGWAEMLDGDDRFSEVIIFGHSEGALLGALASQEDFVDKFISVAGTGRPIDVVLREQFASQPPVLQEDATRILDSLLDGETVDSIHPMLFAAFRPSVQPYIISWMAYDPAKEFSKLEKPTLIVQGSTDIQVGVVDAESLHKANDKSELAVFEGMNHILKEAPADRMPNIMTYNNPELPLFEGVIERLVTFIKR